MATKVVGIVMHPTKNIDASLGILAEWAAAGDVTLLALDSGRAAAVGDIRLVDADRFRDEVDALVAVGGDGTMLGAMRQMATRPVPVLGVNYGNLGFLVEIGRAS